MEINLEMCKKIASKEFILFDLAIQCTGKHLKNALIFICLDVNYKLFETTQLVTVKNGKINNNGFISCNIGHSLEIILSKIIQ